MSEMHQINIKLENQGTQIAALKKEQADVNKGLSEVCQELRALTNQMAVYSERQTHASEKYENASAQIKDLESRVFSMERIQANNAPFVELVKTINNRIWVLMIGAIGSATTAALVAVSTIAK